MVKVALINPGKDQSLAVTEPLNLGYIASYLEKNDVEVRIIDELAGQDVKKELNKYHPDIVGITATTPLAPDAYRISDMCRDMGVLTVMGGVHASVLPEEALQHVDIVVKGEGEVAMLDIVRGNIKSGVISSSLYIKNLDDIPPPARHLMKMDFYMYTRNRLLETFLYFVPPGTRAASIITSRGCPFRCIFCHNTWREVPCRFHSVERVISEIKYLMEAYSVEALFFIDDSLFTNRQRLRKICALIKENELNLIWGCNARVDQVDLKTLQMMKQAGCQQITFGFESGSQKILDILRKGTSVEQNKNAIVLCKQVGLQVNGTFMIGNPTETIEDIRMTQRFIMNNDIDSVGICITTPFPGTELWLWCKERGLIPKSFKWSDFVLNRISVPACDTIPPEELWKLYLETVDLVPNKVPVKWIIKQMMVNPTKIVEMMTHAVRSPHRIHHFLKRLTT